MELWALGMVLVAHAQDYTISLVAYAEAKPATFSYTTTTAETVAK